MTQTKRKLRFHWRRLATIVIGVYLVYWAGVSVHHIMVISQDTSALSHKITVIREKNHVLTTDIHILNNPQQLKGMLSGKIPFPDPTSP